MCNIVKRQDFPGELLTCELCGQQPESIAFDIDECPDDCLFKRLPIESETR
jgi:hypothetical protein